jgi:hypothetical protein
MAFDDNPTDDRYQLDQCIDEIKRLKEENKMWRLACVAPEDGGNLAADNARLLARLRHIRRQLEIIVCTSGRDRGVIYLSNDGPTHTEIVDGKPCQVYDHDNFSPLGDALISLYELTA